MKKILLILILPFYVFGLPNPYINLDKNEKLNVMINHFLNLALEKTKPPFPQKRELKDDGATLDPVKYELYFSYIQRLKAIRESRAEEQVIIDEDYLGKIGFYNGKLKSLKKFYTKNENLYPLLKESINKAFKIVFGKPSFSDITYNDEINLLKGTLSTTDIYGISDFLEKELEFFVYKGNRDDFMQNYKSSDIKVRFNYDSGFLIYKDVIFIFKEHEYIAKFINPSSHKIKLDIKINDDIFQAIQIGDIK